MTLQLIKRTYVRNNISIDKIYSSVKAVKRDNDAFGKRGELGEVIANDDFPSIL